MGGPLDPLLNGVRFTKMCTLAAKPTGYECMQAESALSGVCQALAHFPHSRAFSVKLDAVEVSAAFTEHDGSSTLLHLRSLGIFCFAALL